MPPSFSGGLLCATAAVAAKTTTEARTPDRTRFMEASLSTCRIAFTAFISIAAIMPQAIGSGKPRAAMRQSHDHSQHSATLHSAPLGRWHASQPSYSAKYTKGISKLVLQQRHAAWIKITRVPACCCRREHARTTFRQRNSRLRLRGGPMKPFRGYKGFIDGLTFLCRPGLGSLRAMAIALLLVIPIGASTANALTNPASAASGAHVYLLRGVLNIFSLGLDEIAAKLQQQGITVTVANYLSWASLAEEAAAEYKSGRTKTIILVGHSSGATALPDMVARLDQLGAPVKLAIGLDSVFRTSLTGRVGRYINFYVANGNGEPVATTAQFRGNLENVDVGRLGMGHLTIDKSEVMQRKVISAIDAVAFSRPVAAAPLTQA